MYASCMWLNTTRHSPNAQVAAAPRVRANKIQGLQELEQDAAAHALPRQQDRDIDLSILTSALVSSELVRWVVG